jgi:hypothetical protein
MAFSTNIVAYVLLESASMQRPRGRAKSRMNQVWNIFQPTLWI